MAVQTLTLMQFFLIAYSNKKNAIILFALLAFAVIAAHFIEALSLSQGEQAALAFQAEFFRYAFILLSVLTLVVAVADDYETRQFETLLSMPLHRWQYIAAQFLAMAVVNFVFSLAAGLVLSLQADVSIALFWVASFWLELLVVSQIALLAIISLEKISAAVMLTLALYLLSRVSDTIISIISMSIEYSHGDALSVLMLQLFQLIQIILPSQQAFVQNDYFFTNAAIHLNILPQLFVVTVYVIFLLSVVLFDFYRKDFALKQ